MVLNISRLMWTAIVSSIPRPCVVADVLTDVIYDVIYDVSKIQDQDERKWGRFHYPLDPAAQQPAAK